MEITPQVESTLLKGFVLLTIMLGSGWLARRGVKVNYTRKLNRLESGEEELEEIFTNIECPTFLAWGTETFVEDPEESGRLAYFKDAIIKRYPGASHWVHHDKLEDFLGDLKAFI